MKKFLLLFIVALFNFTAKSQNPIIDHIYTADPAAMVYGDSIYIYTGHDEATIGGNGYVMNDWHVFSSGDMENWHDHGEVLSLGSFSWATANAWASHTVERNGKFYWYVTVSPNANVGGVFAIGVAVSNTPTGPFTDAIGTALITDNLTPDITFDIDPAVFIDDDGLAYLYWGNGGVCKVVKLKENMVELDGDIVDISPAYFTEAAYMHKRNGIYYLSYAGNWPETIEYATSDSPTGPFAYRGRLNALTSSTTNHQSIVEYKNQWYFIYHTADLPEGGDFRRSVAIEYLYYNDDNTIQEIVQTPYGVAASDITAECPPVSLLAYSQINSETEEANRFITLSESDDLILRPVSGEDGSWEWEGPNGFSSIDTELIFSNISHDNSGVYLAIFTNNCGTRSYTSYTLTVNYGLPVNITSGNTYVIEPVNSGMVLSVENSGTVNGSNIIQATNNHLASQRFVITLVDDVYWKIVPENISTRAFDVFNISAENGANICLWDYWGGYGQQWQFAEISSNIYSLISRNSQKCLDVDQANNNLIQWECSGAENQQFKLTEYLVSIGETQPLTGIAIYPLPADSGNFTIEMNNGQSMKTIQFIDTNGKLVYSAQNITAMSFKPDFNFESGLYVIIISTEKSTFSEKVLIKNL